MNKNGHVIIIVEEKEDELLFASVFETLNYPNKITFFRDAEAALQFLNNPLNMAFIILSDIKKPRLTGIELIQKLETDASLNIKCIAYLFFSTAVIQKEIIDAYSQSVQGFFIKQNNVEDLTKTVSSIMDYWKRSYHPSVLLKKELAETG